MGMLRLAQVAFLAFGCISNAQVAENPNIDAQSAEDITPEQQALAEHLELYWSYGRSPEVLPSPEASGVSGWEESFNYARDLVAQMTNDEKNNITYGFVDLETLSGGTALTRA